MTARQDSRAGRRRPIPDLLIAVKTVKAMLSHSGAY